MVERTHNLILDGHHRFQVAKRLGLRTIPAVLVNYAKIDFWSLREEEVVDEHTIAKSESWEYISQQNSQA